MPLGPMLAAGTALVGGGAAIAHAYRHRDQAVAEGPQDTAPDADTDPLN